MDRKDDNFAKHILPWIVCSLAALFYFYEFVLRVAPSVMINDMMGQFGINAAQFGILTAFYYYAYTPMQMVVGVLIDKFGPRKLLSFSIIACFAGSFLISMLPSYLVGKVAIFMMGFGSSFAFVSVIKLAVNWMPANRLAFVTGISTMLGLIGGICAEALMEKVVTTYGWMNAWYYMGFVGIVILILTLLFVHDHPKEKKEAHDEAASTCVFKLLKELKAILKKNAFIINGIIGGITFLPISLFGSLWGIPFLEQAAGLSHADAANTLPIIFLGMAIGGPIFGLLSERIKQRKILIQANLVVVAILFSFVLFMPTMPSLLLKLVLLTMGFMTGAQVLVFPIGVELTSKTIAGTAVAATNFLVMLNLMFLQPLVGKILDMQWTGKIVNGVHFYSAESYQHAMLIVPIAFIIGLALSFMVKETHPEYVKNKISRKKSQVSKEEAVELNPDLVKA